MGMNKVIVTRFKDGTFMVAKEDDSRIVMNIAEVASTASWWSGIGYKILKNEITGMANSNVDMLEISHNTIKARKIDYSKMSD